MPIRIGRHTQTQNYQRALKFNCYFTYIFTSCFTSTPSAFEVITVNALYKLLTYLMSVKLAESEAQEDTGGSGERKCFEMA